MEDGDMHTARRLLFATGVSDQHPARRASPIQWRVGSNADVSGGRRQETEQPSQAF
jgi:hypothetical protein